MKWYYIALILCTYGMLKEFKPTEPYLYKYQHNTLNISEDVLNSEVYPWWTYSYLIFLIPALLLTDILLYKPILILESLSFITVWLTLIFGKSAGSQIVGQIFYGCATATEVAYFAYIYVKVDRKEYYRTTSWTRASLQAGKCAAYLLSELIILSKWGTYQTLNYISLGSLCLTFIFANVLPFVSWRDVVNRNLEFRKPPNEDSDEALPPIPQSYLEFVKDCVKKFKKRAIMTYADRHVLKWSFWWAMTACGEFQIGNYIQTLWGEEQKDVSKVYNGFVEASCPLLAVIVILLLFKVEINWKRWGELCLTIAAFVDFGLLLFMALTDNLFVMYGGYIIFRVIYQAMISISQFNIVCHISSNSYGFVFGLNTFIALGLQTILTLVVADEKGLNLPIRQQFIVYSCYHAAIGIVFLLVLVSRFSKFFIDNTKKSRSPHLKNIT